jgi:glucokinase
VGRPAPAVVAVDVGGTSIKAALIGERGDVLHRIDVPTPVGDGTPAVVAAIRSAAAEVAAPGLVAAGIVVPGVVDVVTGTARYSANIGWRDVPLGALLGEDLGVPVAVDHDVRSAGLAERTLGRAHGVADCLVLVIGTGIAGVIVSGGAHVRGATDLAGEIGHVPVYPDGEVCACGQRGCAEAYASAASIARRYRTLAGRELDAAGVVAARASDPVAAQVWGAATDALALAVVGYTMLLDPELIVLGGGLAEAGAALLEPVQAEVAARLTWRPPPAIEVSSLGSRAGQFGAALLAWRAAGRDCDGWPGGSGTCRS